LHFWRWVIELPLLSFWKRSAYWQMLRKIGTTDFSLVGQSVFHPRRDLVVLPAENKVVPDQLFQRGGRNRNPSISFRIPLYRSVPFSFSTQITRPVFPFPPKQLQPVFQRAPDVRFHEADQPLFPAARPGSGVSFLLPDSKPLPSLQTAPCIVPSASLKPYLTSLPSSL